ncbi:MAG: 5'-nucleotidase C-terminal domain-containing protein, partial [Coriobacteriales bacterium]|nr:5'-nucleotidase C-terminal domain-containing protein [Coriobacteriales bacterium]
LMKVNALAQRLEKIDRCHATVLLAHEHAPTVAEELDENSVIDLVLGGHLHTSVKAQTDWGLSYFEPAGLGQAYVYAELDFALENGSPVFKKVGNSKVVNVVSDTSRLTNTPENEDDLDPEIVSLTDEVISELDEVLKKQIGYITEPVSRDALPGGDGRSSAMSNWMASVIARATGADVGFVNSGGVRTEFVIEDGSDKRYITQSDVYTAFPFGNLLYCFKLTYEDLLKVFQYSLTDGGARLVSNMVGINYYYTDQTVQAIVTTDGQEVYVNGTWKDGWKDRTILVAVNEYTATNDRVSSDGMHNPFVTWKDDETKLVDKTRVDNESAIEVLTKEAEANGGHLSVDTNVYTKCEEYTPQPEDDPDDEDEPVVPSTVQMWRLYNPNSGEHFHTASTGERDLLVKAGWQNEGKAWVAPKTSSEPVWRLYNKNGGDHHYTTSKGERDLLIAAAGRPRAWAGTPTPPRGRPSTASTTPTPPRGLTTSPPARARSACSWRQGGTTRASASTE